MIPVSVTDVIKLLDQIPIWKTVKELPKRITELESRVKALEANAANPAVPKQAIPEGRVCPLCGDEMKVTAERPHPTFDFAGVKVHEMKCTACDHKTERDYRPGSGYK